MGRISRARDPFARQEGDGPMGFFTRLISALTFRSSGPIQRLAAYYVLLGTLAVVLLYFFPIVGLLFSGTRLGQLAQSAQLLQDGLTGAAVPIAAATSNGGLALNTAAVFLG